MTTTTMIQNTFEEYILMDGLNHSKLRDIERGLTYFHKKHILKTISDDKSDALDFGKLFHEFVLEPEVFSSKLKNGIYVIGDKIPGNTKAGKAQKESLELANQTLISPAEHSMMHEMLESILKNDYYRMIFNAPIATYKEISLTFDDGILCKSRIDNLVITENIIFNLDIKTTSAKTLDQLDKSIRDYDYDSQAAWYEKAINALILSAPHLIMPIHIQHILIFVNKEVGTVWMCPITEDYLKIGNAKINKWLNKYKTAIILDRWQDEPVVMLPKPPSWYVNKYLREEQTDF